MTGTPTGNRMRREWTRGPVLGAWCTIGSPGAVELMADCGYDFLILDCQHGEFGVTELEPMLRAFGGTEVTPTVRVPHNDYFAIGHALDAGAQTIIVPMVETREQAERAARAVRYQPDGARSWAVTRAARALGSDPAAVNEQVALLLMIETATGLENAAEIASVPGVDGIFVGPADLALTMGLQPGVTAPAAGVEDALDKIAGICAEHGIVAGLAGGAEYARHGFRVLTVGNDRALLAAGRAKVDEARAAAPSTG
ncbi:aldolase/citrate lyase family protein [Pseudonocardia sp. RS11V-5]|uniref:HpcH/HpaI aldolase family protein n=1 Tax=Pseudonocardia terrae TaxID=2905831 RepID=UPI001E4B305E|nr:aldolase/citrate lyase family protein [Pseudonocardia terrae]MCE3551402.1 aldolase/citrate lyase family protein [Pseudonocardia terrae]